MKARIYEANYGQRYTITEDKYGCTVLRKLPNNEYWNYYRERRDELCVDNTSAYWLPICRAWSQEDAEGYLYGLGVNCAEEVAPCKPEEGVFAMTDRNAKALAWI